MKPALVTRLPLADVIVIGAGPTGLYAALRLAEEGVTVVVLEEHAKIGVPTHCTRIVSAETNRLYKILEEIVLNRWCDHLRPLCRYGRCGGPVPGARLEPRRRRCALIGGGVAYSVCFWSLRGVWTSVGSASNGRAVSSPESSSRLVEAVEQSER